MLLAADLTAFMEWSVSSQILLGMALVFGCYMAWNIGANDVANAMGTSVGSGALTLRQAIIVAAIFEFAGAYLVGSNVSSTIRKGIFDPALIADANVLAMGMIASLLAAGVWLQIASYFGWPVSTTHSIVGAVVGFGCVAVGFQNVQWGLTDFSGVTKIAASWIISPLIAGSISFLLFKLILRTVFFQANPVRAAKRVTPYLVFCVAIVMISVTSFKAMKHVWESYDMKYDDPLALMITAGIAIVVGIISAIVGSLLVRRIEDEPIESTNRFTAVFLTRSLDKALKHLRRVSAGTSGKMQDDAEQLLAQTQALSVKAAKQTDPKLTHNAYQKVERIFIYLQILSACFVAFAHGANDVANAIGPLSAAVQALSHGVVQAKADVPTWALMLGGVGIIFGLATWGWRVMATIGRRITELTPTRGFTAEFGAAITILLASLMGLPISTTHSLVGAVLGVGLARGIGAINLNTVRDIAISWVITIPAGAGLAIIFYYIMRALFG